MSDIEQGRKALRHRILDGKGDASSSERLGAFNNNGLTGPLANLIEKVAHSAWTVTDDDLRNAKASLTEDQIFELVVCAAVGQATRQYEDAMSALTEAIRS